MNQKILNKRSTAVVDGAAKLPLPSQLEYGEMAVNFADGYETISIKNNSDEITTFSCDTIISGMVESSVSELQNTIESNFVSNSTFSAHTEDSVTMKHLPAVDSSNNGDVVKVINGRWQLTPSVSAVQETITNIIGQDAISGGNTTMIAIQTTAQNIGGQITVTLTPMLDVQVISAATSSNDGLVTAYDVQTHVQDNLTTIKTWSLSDIQ